jgi:hypothetical protein
MTVRKYTSRSQQTSLSSAVTSGATVIPVTNASALLAGTTISAGQTFVVVIDPDTALEEIVEITAASSNNLTVTRAVDMSGASAQDHSSGALVRHMIIGRDLRESNLHIEATGAYNDGTGTHAMHGLGSSDGVVVGTTATQTLTNKTLTAPVLTGAGVDASIVFEGATADAFETTLTVVDPTQDNVITLPNTTGTVTILTATQTMTNKTLTSPVISGSPVITGLSSAGMSASSATPKDYVDSILGSATAAATSAASAATSASSAATSATSAAASASAAVTSANSAATSATNAATSAASALTSQTAAATSATSAAASATAAATSATSAAASATAAATSATSAAASATTAAASVASILSAATSASNSASAAATSATSAAASVTAAATSATSAAASATAAATSASSALTSQTAAATSATSALASQTAAATSAASALTSQTAAATSAASALTSQTAAATSATSAAASQTAAATSASSAATSASSAATSASDAATTYDNFDDRYLGSKSSAPTVDNDGNTLLVGAIYWNDVLNNMYVWSGSTWVQIATTSVYSAPTLGSTTIASGTTYTNVDGLTINSTTIPTSKTLVATDTTDFVKTAGGSVISANTSSTALEIRQVGAGNAFAVEDSTNPDTTPFVINASGNVGIGTSNPLSLLSIYSPTDAAIIMEGDGTASVNIMRTSSDVAGSNILLRKARGTSTSKTAINNNDSIGFVGMQGFDGTTYLQGADVLGQVDGTVSTGVVPGRLIFRTASSTGTNTERMRITSAGLVGIGGTPSSAMVQIFNNTAANAGTIIRGAASQTGDLLQLQNSSGVSVAAIGSSGGMTIANNVQYSSKDSGGTTRGILFIGSDNFTNISDAGNAGIRFLNQAQNTVRMIIDSSGNVNVGSGTGGGTNTGGLSIGGEDIESMIIMGAWL